MKRIGYLLGMIGLMSCQPTKEKAEFWDYAIGKNNTGQYREYRYVKDTSMFRVFVRLTTEQVDDSTWDLSTYMVNIDSVPLMKTKERDTNHTFAMLENSVFEFDQKTNQINEVKGKLSRMKRCSIEQKSCSFTMEYTFPRSTLAQRIQIEATWEFQPIDSLTYSAIPYLVIRNHQTVYQKNLSSRKDTSQTLESINIYAKDKGLVTWILKSANQTIVYKLVE